ncbi:tRNA (adenosine(37)-N6)-threonylcarbamoyltransferase complex dimerization subunit type 1 TsaB [Thiosulfativibrio zosterae]|uniref:tRNA threonylcarbamoyladenosine biosynthesis protein TsaB n=1 Tax=Thiosulfativibrio zosterae TaxID=2675053 RepID=A0A6F8PNT8_9GAMM|nr:tRNA (adenosine(37)-N6)-threonylcarbamoyltransferase complex dimerization subunit type 1 TsaB [Thiosulfativibrio zosterae]BBP43783.1 tRNA (adenosine(37)-N6)-threonylcarbamoyltransferase complex dimerization subunit type 1 TsaB [Thiosulfativibrio zosterae]
MNILAIETATQACSASVYKEGVLFSRFEMAPQKHANLILGMVEAVLAEASLLPGQLDALAFSEGPGAFTGVRVATGVIQGLAYGWQKPVIGVSTLEALIWQAYEATGKTEWQACLDARMKEVYCQKGSVVDGRLVSEPTELVSLEIAEQRLQDKNGVGDIALEYPDLVEMTAFWQADLPKAAAIAMIASQRMDQACSVLEKVPVPVYLRNNVAEKKKGV